MASSFISSFTSADLTSACGALKTYQLKRGNPLRFSRAGFLFPFFLSNILFLDILFLGRQLERIK
jgi:hypothetical protein